MGKAPKTPNISDLVAAFHTELNPVEAVETLQVLTDNRTGARYCECHVRASKLIEHGTTHVPLDPSFEKYKANRELATDNDAFEKMKADALARRSFSNIVTEYRPGVDPLKVIGGQHRFVVIEEALAEGVDELHGIKVYFDLNMDQQLDVQLISNTNIEVSKALGDRLKETARGAVLRDWCQSVGLLQADQDFGDRKARSGPITVDIARTFITNFYEGQKINAVKFKTLPTTPIHFRAGSGETEWLEFLQAHPKVWSDTKLRKAAKEFVRLHVAQKASWAGKKLAGKNPPVDYSDKAMQPAVMSGWAFVAGALQKNPKRLAKHYALADAKGYDPLNAEALAAGRHHTDGPQYRGLGARFDPRERGQMVELFWMLAEDGLAVNKGTVKSAIYAYKAKENEIMAREARAS